LLLRKERQKACAAATMQAVHRSGGLPVQSLSRLTALLGALLVCSFAGAETAPQLFARYAAPHAGDAVTVSNLTITSGAMKFTLTSGSAAPVKAGDEVVGLFFVGDAAFDYAVSDSVELPLAK